jgi:hypothetical protein
MSMSYEVKKIRKENMQLKKLHLDIKRCTVCLRMLPFSEYYIRNDTMRPKSQCKKCECKYKREQNKKKQRQLKKKKVVKKNMVDEKAENFKRLALGRTNRILKLISLLGNLANSSYHSTQEERDTVTDTIQQGLNKLKGIYKPKTLTLEFKKN